MLQSVRSLIFASSLVLLTCLPAFGQNSGYEADRGNSDVFGNHTNDEINPLTNLTNVTQLTDIKSTDWAFQALQSLVERYGCITGYPDNRFQGNRALTRNEFAAGLNACLDQIQALITSNTSPFVSKTDFDTLTKLQTEFATELQTFRQRLDILDRQAAKLEKQSFSTTTKLTGQVIMAANFGGFTGDRVIGVDRREITRQQPEATIIARTALFLNTSFTGKDLLQILLDSGTGGTLDNTAAVLEPTFGSNLDYSAKPGGSGELGIGRLAYTFNPSETLTVAFGPNIRTTDYIDRNRYANRSFFDFGTQALVNNFALLPVYGPSAGGALEWRPHKALTLRGVYAAIAAATPGQQIGPVRGIGFIARSFYANPTGAGGLFGDTYQGSVELEYRPFPAAALRFAYSGGKIFDHRFSAVGVNAEWAINKQIGIFGRYSRANYDGTIYGDLDPQSWMAGISVSDVGKQGAIVGMAIGQPVVEKSLGRGTQTNWELFYNYPINASLRLSPALQIISNAGNQSSNSTFFAGTMRMVFSF